MRSSTIADMGRLVWTDTMGEFAGTVNVTSRIHHFASRESLANLFLGWDR